MRDQRKLRTYTHSHMTESGKVMRIPYNRTKPRGIHDMIMVFLCVCVCVFFGSSSSNSSSDSSSSDMIMRLLLSL